MPCFIKTRRADRGDAGARLRFFQCDSLDDGEDGSRLACSTPGRHQLCHGGLHDSGKRLERDDGAAAGHASQAHGNTDRLASSINQGPLVFCCLQQVRTRIPHAPRRPKPNLAPDWSFSDSDQSGAVLVFLLFLSFVVFNRSGHAYRARHVDRNRT